jgi:hypothetical protein
MRFLFIVLATLFASLGFAQDEVKRSSYLSAGKSEDALRKFYLESAAYSLQSPLDKAYRGVAIAMYASLENSVVDKFNTFSKGKILIEEAVAADWYNPEIRFLRFSVQAEVPLLVGYSSNLEDDAYVVLDALEKKRIDTASYFWSVAVKFMLNSGELNSDQQNRFNKFNS